jgi:acyl-CoA reductase-like NAD-dependent aldehyde dehydrogenase
MSDQSFTMTIGGKGVPGAATYTVTNPATGQVIASAPDCSRDELDQAVAAARAAFPGWAARPISERRAMLIAIADAIDANVDVLARLVTAEQGKPLALAQFEVGFLTLWLRESARLEIPEIVNQDDGERRSVTRRIPLGVVAAILPWNYPIGQNAFKFGPAMLAGNTVIVKPSALTPLTNLKLGEILRDIVPAGVLNFISGGDGLGEWVTSHPGFDRISFTGSTRTGRLVMASAAKRLTGVTLELGGNDPAIVMPDVDIKATVEKLFWAAFVNSGQLCLAIKRLYVHADIYDNFAAELADYARGVVVGDGLSEGVQLGPVSNRQQYDTVVGLIRDAQDKGYRFLTGGLPDESAAGFFVAPTIIDNPPEDARIVQEEQFGPVLPLLKFSDVDDVVARANGTDFGLGASVWSADVDAAFAIAQRLQAGTVWVNEVQHLAPDVPFGGLKQSGLGTESGQAGLLDYTDAQTLTIKR